MIVANNQLVQLRFARVCNARLLRDDHCTTPRFLQSRRGQDFKIDRVIEIVTVIGDFICQIGNLRLQRRAIVFFLCRSGEFVRSLMLSQAFTHFEREFKPGKSG